MALTVGADTYATLAEADAYAAARSWTDWDALSDAAKELRLTEAAIYLDTSYTWKGAIAAVTQAMAWPRTGVTDGEGRTIASDAYPDRLKAAQIEYARLAETAALVTNDAQGEVKSIQAGSVGITFKDAQNVSEAAKYRSIDRLLTGLYLSRAGLVRNVRLSKA
jgi:hypothetical protein